MKKILSLIIAVCTVTIGFAASPTPSSEKYQRVLDNVIALQEDSETVAAMLEETFKTSIGENMSSENLHNMCVEMTECMMPYIFAEVKKLYVETFTYEELLQLEEWLQSPAGKKMSGLQSRVTEMASKVADDPAVQGQILLVLLKYMD